MRFGIITHVVGDADSRTVLRETIELAQIAEESGFTSFWVAQHHFGSHRGHAPSPLVLLAAIARDTDRIALGTAVVAGALENPVRLAEDAATVDAISGGRLQLGLGAGADPTASRVFGVAHEDRHRALREHLHLLCAELDGDRLCPGAAGLRERLWLATGSDDGYALATELRTGVLAGRRASPNLEEDRATAARMATFREQARGDSPRIGLSRAVFCADDYASARSALAPGIDRWIHHDAPPGRFPDGYTVDDYLAARHIFAGSPADVRRHFHYDPCTRHVTDVLANVPQVHPDFTDNARSIRTFGARIIRGGLFDGR
ncbi:LLM class flavin-dependent oxidoreductase [Prescottella sp. R16]|uniref:LLM class flavin-dependent oxidoreductase n=1 Tax=Prescottella sp. R16 TaxID=3064529 RepID=UPI00272EBB9D|nr:LLM class flavin-dependent oxidoreductase [Prescottella sp. R16]